MHVPLTMVVAWRHVRAWPRQRYFYLLRLAVVGSLSSLMVFHYFVSMMRRQLGAGGGGTVILGLIGSCMVLCGMVLGPYMGLVTVLKERRGKAQEAVLMTDITPWKLLVGQVAAGWGMVMSLCLMLLPILVLMVSLGGIGFAQVGATLVLVTGTCLLGVALGMAAGSIRGSVFFSYALVTLIVGTLLGVQVMPWFGIFMVRPRYTLWRMLDNVARGEDLEFVMTVGLVEGGAGLVILVLLGLIVNRMIWKQQRMGGEVIKRPGAVARVWARVSGSIVVKRQRLDSMPVAWRDLFFLYRGQRLWWWLTGVLVLLVFGVGMLIEVVAPYSLQPIYSGTYEPSVYVPMVTLLIRSGAVLVILVGLVGLPVAYFGVMLTTAQGINREREEGTLDILVLCGWSAEELLLQKTAAAYLAFMPAIVVGLGSVGSWVLIVGFAGGWETVMDLVRLGLVAWGLLLIAGGAGAYLGVTRASLVELWINAIGCLGVIVTAVVMLTFVGHSLRYNWSFKYDAVVFQLMLTAVPWVACMAMNANFLRWCRFYLKSDGIHGPGR